jgi:hypothetical protein
MKLTGKMPNQGGFSMAGHDGAKRAGGLGKTARAALFCLAAAAMGVALYRIGHMYATGQRGYVAYGGELLFLLFPLYACAARQAARELAKGWKEARGSCAGIDAWQGGGGMRKAKTVTVRRFMAFGPCAGYPEGRIRRIAGGKEEWGALDILALGGVPAGDRLWAVLREELVDAAILHEFACRCAERALALVPDPDPRSIEGLAAKRRWLAGEATDAELDAAWHAAWHAAWDDAMAAAQDAERERQIETLRGMLRAAEGKKNGQYYADGNIEAIGSIEERGAGDAV